MGIIQLPEMELSAKFNLVLCDHTALTAAVAVALPVMACAKVRLLIRLFQKKLRGLFFLDKILHELWEFALFCLIRFLVSKLLLIHCCNSVTEDHSIVFLALCVAVFNKPLDYPCYFKYREWCFKPWVSQLKAILHQCFLQVFYWEFSLKFWH